MEGFMARDKNTYAKRQRETQKRQKAEAKQERRQKRKKRQANRAPNVEPGQFGEQLSEPPE